MSTKSALTSALALALGALALTACQSDGTGAAGAGPAPSTAASDPAATTAPSATAPSATAPDTAPSAATTAADAPRTSGKPAAAAAKPKAPATKPPAPKSEATSDSYAFTHPCAAQQLTVRVTRISGAPSQRVISVRNNGSRSCGLSYYPLVSLDNAKAAGGGHTVRPIIPSGLGGAPAYPVYAGHTAYAVIDLDPSGATAGTVPGVDELNVLADGDHMPDAATLNFPLDDGALVLKPKLGLYRSNVGDAVSSMRTADYQS